MRNLCTLFWVAAIALLLVGVITSNVQAQEGAPAAQPGSPQSPPVGDPKCQEGQGPPCYLTSAHFSNLDGRIQALKSQLTDLQSRIEELQSEKQAAEKQGDQQRAAQLEAAQTVLVQKIEALTEELGRLTDTITEQAAVPSWAGWKWGALARVGVPFFTGSPKWAIPIQVEGSLRYVSTAHLGLELAAVLGVWQTEDVAPMAFTSRVAGVASFAHGGVFVGPEVSVLQNTYRDDHALLLVTLPVGAEWHVARSGWTWRVAVAPTLHSEWARTSGQPWIQVGFGYLSP